LKLYQVEELSDQENVSSHDEKKTGFWSLLYFMFFISFWSHFMLIIGFWSLLYFMFIIRFKHNLRKSHMNFNLWEQLIKSHNI
jgi:hypothetical protein